MTTTTLVPAVIDYLVAQATAALPGVTVLDGPNTSPDVLENQQLLWIGSTGPHEATVEAATAEQDWPVLDGARTTDETGEIVCAAEFWSGDATMKTNRDTCAGIVEAVAALLRGTPVMGGPGDTTMGNLVSWSIVKPVSWQQAQRSDSVAVLCQFKVAYYGRIVT